MIIMDDAMQQAPESERLRLAIFLSGEALMAAARDQAARALRAEAEETEGEHGAGLGEQLRTHVAEETRRQAEAPTAPPSDKPAQGAAPAPKPGKRKFILFGFLALLAI